MDLEGVQSAVMLGGNGVYGVELQEMLRQDG